MTDPTLVEASFRKNKELGLAKMEEKNKKLIEAYGGGEHLKNKSQLVELYKENLGKEQDFLIKEGVDINTDKYYVDTKQRQVTTKKSKYPEDVIILNHKSVWGSWWNEVLGWGYSCCHGNDKY